MINSNFYIPIKRNENIMKNKVKILFVVLPIIIFTLSGCYSKPTESKTVKTNQSTNYNTLTPQVTKGGPSSPTIHTPTIIEPTLWSLPTPQITPTYYPISKLTTKQQMEIMDFLIETPECKLPCWNGLTPGISKSIEIQGFYARLGYDYPSKSIFSKIEGHSSPILKNFILGTFSNSSNESSLLIDVIWSNNIVDSIGINGWDHPEQINIKQISEKLHMPDQILVLQDQGDRYSILLHYVSKKTIIEITGMRTMIDSTSSLPFQVCMNRSEKKYISAIFYSEQYLNKINEDYLVYPWVEWEPLLGITKDELWNKLQQPDACLPYP